MAERDFHEIDVLLIDGNNLLHRMSGSVEPGAQRLVLARLRSAIPSTVATLVMLDGHAAAGTRRREKVAAGFEILHAGSISADDALLNVIADTPFSERHATVIVTDDRALGDRARHLGARTQRLQWLERLMSAPQPGAPRPPAAPRHEATDSDEREPWTPGRGATRKRGNPKRRAR